MELVKIEKLIDKYLEATTTLEEEQELRGYFASSNVAPHLEQYKPLFNYLSSAKDETYTQAVPLKPRRNFYKWVTVAAVFILSLGFYTSYMVKSNKKEQEEAMLAYYQTKEALQLLSSKFNKGAEKVTYLNEFENARNKIFNTKNNN